jgi:pimeloyl-ACP methyl ester carboxylesterase
MPSSSTTPAGRVCFFSAMRQIYLEEILPDCEHVPQFERPEQTHELVCSFLADQR